MLADVSNRDVRELVEKMSAAGLSLIVKKIVRRAELLKSHRHGFRRALD